MNDEIKAKWLKALRSGEYEQGTRNLECRGKFCCLGVLYDIGQESGVLPMRTKAEAWTNHEKQLLCNWSGFIWTDEHEFAVVNDDGATFEQIALCIENGL